MSETTIEAASRDGITIGLIDSIITIATVLRERLNAESRRLKRSSDEHAWHSQPVQDALHDLAANPTVRGLLWPRDDNAMEIIHRAAESVEAKSQEQFNA